MGRKTTIGRLRWLVIRKTELTTTVKSQCRSKPEVEGHTRDTVQSIVSIELDVTLYGGCNAGATCELNIRSRSTFIFEVVLQ